MPDKKSPSLFFDTVVLSNFAFAENGLAFLKKRYQKRGVVTLQVLQEIAKSTYTNWHALDQIEKILFGKVGFQKTTLKENEESLYLICLRNLGEGEASCIAAAHFRKGVVVTDDRVARNFCKEKSIGISGIIGILKAATLDNTLTIEQADLMLSQMIAKGFYSPVQRISDIY